MVLGTPGPWNPWTLGLLDLFPPPTPPHTSPYIILPPPISSSYSPPLVWFSNWVVGVSCDIEEGDWRMISKSCEVGEWNPGTSSFLLHSLPITSSHLLLIPPSYSSILPNLLLTPPPKGSQMTNEFIHEEISLLFCSEKFHGGAGGWRHCNYRVKLKLQVQVSL